MSGKKAVLFDMDGVIFDSERAVLAIWRELAKELGLGEIEPAFLRCVGTNKARTREIFREVYPAQDFDDFDRLCRERFLARYGAGRLPVKAGAREVLAALKARGVPLALASSTRRETVCRELGEAGLLGCFYVIVGGDQVTAPSRTRKSFSSRRKS